jgi:serine/threonine protein kinase
MPFCKKCGKKLDDDAAFCPGCGTPVSKAENTEQTAESRKQKSESSEDAYRTQIRGASSYGVLNLEDLPAGHVIDDRYEIQEKVGQGGFGAVYRVFDRTMEIDKALKVIPQAVVSDAEALYDLQQEAKTMIALNHPNIVRVFDFHNTGSIKYIDMEYVPGKTLTQLKLECPNKQMPEAQVKEYAIKIAQGMAYAHQNNVLHKDIKPQNIKVTPEGAIKIMDFGIAETVRTSMSRIQNSSSSGTLVYMSPEQIKGKNVGKESDIYSFGAMLYELLSGHPPFYKGDISYQILNEEPGVIEHVSEGIWRLVKTCLAKDYMERYSTFDEVIHELTGTVLHAPVSPQKPVVLPIQPEEIEIQEPESIPGMVFVQGGIKYTIAEGINILLVFGLLSVFLILIRRSDWTFLKLLPIYTSIFISELFMIYFALWKLQQEYEYSALSLVYWFELLVSLVVFVAVLAYSFQGGTIALNSLFWKFTISELIPFLSGYLLTRFNRKHDSNKFAIFFWCFNSILFGLLLSPKGNMGHVSFMISLVLTTIILFIVWVTNYDNGDFRDFFYDTKSLIVFFVLVVIPFMLVIGSELRETVGGFIKFLKELQNFLTTILS